MRILVAHNHYQIAGGEDESYRSEVQMLRDAGHEVEVIVEHNDRVKHIGALRMAARTVWSGEAYDTVARMARTWRPDVMHVQNFFPLLSPSMYYAARRHHVPVVQSLRNYRLLCPNALFFRAGRVCEDCLGKIAPWPGVMHGCYRDSRMASAVVATMASTHAAIGTWRRMVEVYIALTDFARRKFIEGGLPAERIVVKPNFVVPDPGCGEHRGNYALFVGRLTPEKGILTLLTAWERLGGQRELRIVGEGPLQDHVQALAERTPGVTYLGRRSVTEVYDLMGDAAMVVFPSEWYETFGRIAIEAFAKGAALIASNIGAIAELVEHGRTGLLFAPGDVADLVHKLQTLFDQPDLTATLRRNARREYEQKYTARANYEQLMEIYQRAIGEVYRGELNAPPETRR